MPKAVRARHELARGINKVSRGVNFGQKRKYLFVPGGPKYKKVEKQESKSDDAPKSRFYEGDDRKKPMPSRKPSKPATLKANYEPGTVLIVLSGRFRGKRVVFLKQLASGLLLVTGPYKVNGVPLRRVNQVYTIATTTKIPLDGVNVDKIEDAFFARKASADGKGEEEFFAQGAESKVEISSERKEAQKAVDAGLLKTIGKMDLMKSYLNAKFSLTRGQRPHEMVF